MKVFTIAIAAMESYEYTIAQMFVGLGRHFLREFFVPQCLWYEFEEAKTAEARFARALDNLEVQIQHNLAQFETWEEIEYDLVYNKMDKYCKYDPFLKELCNKIKEEAEDKMIEGGIDVESVKARATRLL